MNWCGGGHIPKVDMTRRATQRSRLHTSPENRYCFWEPGRKQSTHLHPSRSPPRYGANLLNIIWNCSLYHYGMYKCLRKHRESTLCPHAFIGPTGIAASSLYSAPSGTPIKLPSPQSLFMSTALISDCFTSIVVHHLICWGRRLCFI